MYCKIKYLTKKVAQNLLCEGGSHRAELEREGKVAISHIDYLF